MERLGLRFLGRLVASRVPLRASWSVLMASWASLRESESLSDAIFEGFWNRYGASSLRKSSKNAKKSNVFLTFSLSFILCTSKLISGVCWIVSESTWRLGSPLGASRAPPETFLRRLGPPLGPLGVSLWSVCGPHGGLWSTLVRLGAPGSPLLEVLARSWVVLGALRGPLLDVPA